MPVVMAPSPIPFGPEGMAIEPTTPAVVMRPSCCAVNQRAPSGPAAIANGAPILVVNDVNAPAVVARQIRRSKLSVNQTAPSGPSAILPGFGVVDFELPPGIGNSVNVPSVVRRSTFAAPVRLDTRLKMGSVIQRALSDPVMISIGLGWVGQLSPVWQAPGTFSSEMTPAVVMRPMALASGPVNHNAPSGPLVRLEALRPAGSANSRSAPSVVMRAIWPLSVNHSA